MTPYPPDLTPVRVIANPTVIIGHAFTDTYAGISPASVPGFVAAQGIGLRAALGLIAVVHPATRHEIATPTTIAPERQSEHV